MVSLKAGNVLQPSITRLLAALLEGTEDRFVSLQWVHHCVVMNVGYKNFSAMDGKPLTGHIEQGIFTLVPKEIIYTVSVI